MPVRTRTDPDQKIGVSADRTHLTKLCLLIGWQRQRHSFYRAEVAVVVAAAAEDEVPMAVVTVW